MLYDIPTPEEIQNVRDLGDEHPGDALEDKRLDNIEELTDREMHELKMFLLGRWFANVQDAFDEEDMLPDNETLHGVMELLSKWYDELHFEHGMADDDNWDEVHANLRIKTLNMMREIYNYYRENSDDQYARRFVFAFDHIFEAVHPAHNDDYRDKIWNLLAEEFPNLNDVAVIIDEPADLPDDILAN